MGGDELRQWHHGPYISFSIWSAHSQTVCSVPFHFYDRVKTHEVKLFWRNCDDTVTQRTFSAPFLDELSVSPKTPLSHPDIIYVIWRITFTFMVSVKKETPLFHWLDTQDKYQVVFSNHDESLLDFKVFLLHCSLSASSCSPHKISRIFLCQRWVTSEIRFVEIVLFSFCPPTFSSPHSSLCHLDIVLFSVWSIQLLPFRSVR